MCTSQISKSLTGLYRHTHIHNLDTLLKMQNQPRKQIPNNQLNNQPNNQLNTTLWPITLKILNSNKMKVLKPLETDTAD